MGVVSMVLEDDYAIITDNLGRRFRFTEVFHYANYSSREDYLNTAKRSFNKEGQRWFIELIF